MKIITGIVIIAIIALVVGFIPIMEVPYTATEPLDYKEQSYVKREDTTGVRRAIMGSLPFGADPSTIQQFLMWAYPPGIAEIQPIGNVAITNTDGIEGTFRVRITFYSGDDEYTEDFDLQLKPGQREEVSLRATRIHYDKDKWTWKYEITPDTKTVTYYEKVPIFEYLLSRF
ncbi:hypothetical protein ES708_21242 [subsurface metagenome]